MNRGRVLAAIKSIEGASRLYVVDLLIMNIGMYL